jgi:hypothetical protein
MSNVCIHLSLEWGKRSPRRLRDVKRAWVEVRVTRRMTIFLMHIEKRQTYTKDVGGWAQIAKLTSRRVCKKV